MPRFAANLSMMYTEHPFLERFAAAGRDGFQGVEYLFPFDFPSRELAHHLQEHGLTQVLFNAPPGNWQAGERGLACLPGREAEFREGMYKALEYANALQCPRIHVMAGLAPDGVRDVALHAVYTSNLRWAAEQAQPSAVTILIEPINARDMPGFFLNRQSDAHAIVAEVGCGNLMVQMDLYHCQITEGDLAMKLRQYLGDRSTSRVGHIQVAGVPDRCEPDLGEVNYEYLFDLIDELSFEGWIGCEYRPAASTSAGLEWLHRVRRARGRA